MGEMIAETGGLDKGKRGVVVCFILLASFAFNTLLPVMLKIIFPENKYISIDNHQDLLMVFLFAII